LLEDENLSDAVSELFEQDNNFFSSFSNKDYFDAGIAIKEIEEKTVFLEESLNEKIFLKQEFLTQTVSSLKEQKNSFTALFSQLENALSQSDSYLPPITEKRLAFLKDSFEKINFSFNSDVNSLESLLLAEKQLNEKKQELNEIKEELFFSLNKMQEDAKVFLLSAKLSSQNTSQAEKLFSEGKYIDSINSSLKAQKAANTGFLSLTNFELPIQVYLLFGVICFVLYRKFKGKKKKKKKSKTKISSFSV